MAPHHGAESLNEFGRRTPMDTNQRTPERKLREGDIQSSIAHLKKAIHIQPDYMEAYNNLGTRYMALQDYERAIAHFREALRLDRDAVLAHTNLGLAMFILKDLPEAEAELRSAVRLDGCSAKAHYLLGLVLNSQDRDPAEVVEHLDQSAHEFPKARLLAAQVLAQREGHSIWRPPNRVSIWLHFMRTIALPWKHCSPAFSRERIQCADTAGNTANPSAAVSTVSPPGAALQARPCVIA